MSNANELLTGIPTGFEPLRNNRFRFIFPSELGIMSWAISAGSNPTIAINEIEIPFLNTSNWVIGRYRWESMTITVRDLIGPSSKQAVMEWVNLHAESVTGREGYAMGYKRDIKLQQLDPAGVAVSEWIIQEAMLTNVSFGENSYDDDALTLITMTIRPFYCILSY
ncbi:hypothetical protein EZS27_007739 [termite gut metagenome]|uniref:Uncharacterized protein n=1 Tax=termite gut metagenome TaxID=433724 RepID=A0A5J4SEQ9_9ZZZZ